MKVKGKLLRMALMIAAVLMQSTISVSAANTVFDVPTIDPNMKPNNRIYQSPNLNIIADDWPNGLDANIINTSDLDTLVAELIANVSTAGHSRRNVSFYPEGAYLSDRNIQDLRDAGWNELSLYYYDFFLIGSMPESGISPKIAVTENEDILLALKDEYTAEDVVMFEVSGVNMTESNMALYSEEFGAVKSSSFYVYKYIADVDTFVPAKQCYLGSYASNVLEVMNMQDIESDVNGVYIVVNNELPAELVATADELPILREKQQETEQESEKETTVENVLDKTDNKEENVVETTYVEGNATETRILEDVISEKDISEETVSKETPITGTEIIEEIQTDVEEKASEGIFDYIRDFFRNLFARIFG